MYRVEDKYICNESRMRILEGRIGCILEPDNNWKDEYGYKVTSVYFDDIFDSHLKDTVDGNPCREKYRIRIYNDSLATIKLEVKYKTYNRVLKKSQNISQKQMEACLLGEMADDGGALAGDMPVNLFHTAIAHSGLRPRLIVEYDRSAYVYEPGNVRITFDRNIRMCKETENFGKKPADFKYLEEEGSVLEVKYDEFLPGFISQLLETGNMWQSSYSKYRLCRERDERI